MRRLSAVLLSLSLTSAVFAGVNESDPREKLPSDRLGHAMVLTPRHVLTDADVADLASRGVSVRRALPGGRYLARVKDEVVAATDERIASAVPMTASLKLQRSVLREVAKAKPYVRVNVIFYDDVDFDSARDSILAAGGELGDVLRVRFAPSQRLSARVAPAALQALLADERVMTIIGPAPKPPRSENLVSALVSSVDVVQAAPYNLSGDGVTVSLFELGAAQTTHVEFGGRMVTHAIGGTTDDKLHATHVAGTIGAAGVQPNAKGMAPKVHIEQFCLPVDGSNQCEGDWLEIKDQELTPLGIVADNNSWGYDVGWYDEDGFPVWDGSDIFFGSYAPEFGGPFVDEVSNDRKILFVHSAGNNGNMGGFASEWQQHRHVNDDGDTITTEIFCYSHDDSGTDCPVLCNGTNPETHELAGCEKVVDRHHENVPYDTIGVIAAAKNVIAVGAVSGIPGNLQIASFSSRGPAKDGRVKPDVVTRGVNVLSPVPTDSYARNQGTSMASPVVTGVSALLIEQWRKTFAGANPFPEQLKALILAGTDDLGNPGPDYTYGFGLVNAKKSVDFIIADGGTGARIRNMSFAQGQGQAFEFPLVVSESQNLRVLLNWPDKPTVLFADAEITDSVLVNDLDLQVIDPQGVTHLPYVLDRVHYTVNATTGVNKIDNVELVEIANAPVGNYRVIATGARVSEGPQPAVIVATSTLGTPVPQCIDLIENLGSNNTPGTAFGNIRPGQVIQGAICGADVDYYKFSVTESGVVTVTITAGDTPLRATLTRATADLTIDIPANSSRTLNSSTIEVPMAFLLRIDPNGAIGSSSTYSLTAAFNETPQPRRRAVRR